MDLNPKERFSKTEHYKAFMDISGNPAFHAALEVALAEVNWRLGRNSNDATENWHKLAGAREFATILLNLTELPDSNRKPAPRQNLQPL